MASFIRKRLEMMGARVMEGVNVCRGFAEKIEQGETLTTNEKITIGKLKVAMNRLMSEIQYYTYQHQSTSSEDLEDMEEFISELTTVHMQADDCLVELGADKDGGIEGNHSGPSKENTSSGNTTSRLPQLDLPKFDGNVLNWHEFWGKFTASIESRKDLLDVDKLTYLQDCLQGSAKEIIAGLATTNEAYSIATETLKEEYGEEGILIDAHYTALFNIPKATQEVKENKRVLNEIDRHLRVLDAMGENTGQNNALRALIVNKFSADIQSNLRMKMTPTRETVKTIISTLKLIIKALGDQGAGSQQNPAPSSGFTTESLYSQNSGTPTKRPSDHSRKRKFRPSQQYSSDKRDNKHPKTSQGNSNRKTSTSSNQDNSTRKPLKCIFCSGNHIHEKCPEVTTLEERKAKLKGRCYLCLRENHSVQNCRVSTSACVHCGKQRHHNRVLCPKIYSKGDKVADTVAMFSHTDYDTILQTAVASIKGHKSVKAKILFDCGSQRSYIHSSLAKKLKLTTLEETCLTVFTFGSTTPKTMPANLVKIPIQLKSSTVEIMAYIVPSTTGLLPSHWDFKAKLQKDLPSLDWAEDTHHDTCADIIVGNDYYYRFITPNRKEVAENLFILETRLGWILSGCFKNRVSEKHQLSVLTYVEGNCICKGEDFFFRPDQAIRDDNIKMLWELEAIGITDSPKVVQDEEVIEFFNQTTKFIENRYYVKWPWTEYPPILPRNYGLAFGRLQSLVRRLDSNQLQRYNEVLVEQLKRGIIEEVVEASSPQSHPVHYLPHHCVIQEHKSTKLRIVYDASAKIKGQCSLNELLYKGPLMLEDLTTLLLKFRCHKIGLVADIEKAFLMVGLQTEDRDVTRFLWLRDITQAACDNNLIHFRFCRVPFGIISSPYLLAATIRHHLSSKNTEAARTLASCLYVDNLVAGAGTVTEARQLYHLATESLIELSMNLRGWNSNDKSFLNSVPESHKDTEEKISVLGLKWDTVGDVLHLAFAVSKLNRPVTTKREVLRIIASVFDPCGFVAPLTLPTRTFLQELWKKGLKWDTALSSDQNTAWEKCITFLKGIDQFAIPRKYTPLKDGPTELHCFTDASLDAYVAVVYIRYNSTSQCDVNFVVSRSRVTPLQRKNSLTIPKLELLAVVIGTRLLTYVQKALDLQTTDTFLWTDNQAVLGWLQTERLLPPWISRRVGEAHKAQQIRFRYVPSSLNPADIATRPLQQNVIPDCWIQGPAFLRLSMSQWPSQHLDTTVTSDSMDEEPTAENSSACLGTQVMLVPTVSTGDWQLPTHGATLPLPAIIQLQNTYFKDEVAQKTTNLSRSLGLFRDDKGILRCKGRYQNSILPYDQRFPILLPPDSDLTTWVIQRVHTEHYHVGVAHTLSLVRQNYWIPRGRNAVTKVIKHCENCVKYGGGPYRLPDMPDLPFERINYSPPFTYTGLDYLGPLVVTLNGSKHKRWVCLFTCLAVRAVHLEVVNDLSADEFILCLRRFVATRGAPKLLISDNATHFKLAATILTAPIIKQNDISWKFIAELSPWQGGVYERLVGLVKHCLHRTVDKSLLNDSQLSTVMKEIEGVLNTRPLTTVGPDHDFVLTPSQFLRVSGFPALQPPDRADDFRTDIQQRVVKGWKRTSSLLHEFQKMFVHQYLLSLRERHSPTIKQPRVLSYKEPQIGDIVQIKGETNNRALWKTGKISGFRPSCDGQVRTAQVDLGNGSSLNRSIGQLYPLELDVSHPDLPDTADDPPDTHTASHDPGNNPIPSPTAVSASPEGVTQDVPHERPQRQAAHRARQQIRQWVTAMFSLATIQLAGK